MNKFSRNFNINDKNFIEIIIKDVIERRLKDNNIEKKS